MAGSNPQAKARAIQDYFGAKPLAKTPKRSGCFPRKMMGRMAKSGLIPFTARTPLPDLPSVELSLERWNDHIIANHAEMAGKEALLLATLTAPTSIVKGNPEENVVFVNLNETKLNGSPLVVVVNRPRAFVVTSLYDRRYKTIISGQQIWPS